MIQFKKQVNFLTQYIKEYDTISRSEGGDMFKLKKPFLGGGGAVAETPPANKEGSLSLNKGWEMNTGIPEAHRLRIAEGLSHLLADSYTLSLKTHNYHWNVTGPMFQTLHLMFEKQYKELTLAVDLIAERIRALGIYAPGSYTHFKNLSRIQEETEIPKAMLMVENLTADQETLIQTARAVLPLAQEANDEATADMLIHRIAVHEKTAWILRSLLEE